MLLAEAYAGAGRTKDAIAWLEERNDPRLMPCARRFLRARTALVGRGQRLRARRRSARRAISDLKTRYASALLNDRRPRRTPRRRATCSREVVSARADAPSRSYLLSQAQRRLGDAKAGGGDGAPRHRAEQQEPVGLLRARRSARRAARVSGGRRPSSRRSSPNSRGTARRTAPFDVSACCCRISDSRTRSSGSTTRRLPTFEDARRLAPERSDGRRAI